MSPPLLPSSIRRRVDCELARHTRIHPAINQKENPLWIKREDELSSGISGSKLRKYASIFPALKEQGIATVGIIGGPNSNNLVGIVQLLRENGISPLAFIRESADRQLQGNALFLRLLLKETEIIKIPRSDWHRVEEIAAECLGRQHGKTKLLREGCLDALALPGALTLAESVILNEKESHLHFDRIYIDSGTGLSAIGLIIGLQILEAEEVPMQEVVVTLIAGTEREFLDTFTTFQNEIVSEFKVELSGVPKIRFISPLISPKFGSVNKSLMDKCVEIGRIEGILMDPTYSVKHYDAAVDDLNKRPVNGNSLFVYNGSSLGLCGFQSRLQS